jgi:hypothetical protein
LTVRASDIFSFIRGEGGIPKLRAAIAHDLEPYRRGLLERGRSAPVTVDSDADADRPLLVDASAILLLCRARASGELDASEFSYVVSILDLSPSFTFPSANLRELVQELSNPRCSDREFATLHSKLKRAGA